MPQATVPFDESELTLEASDVYVLAAAQDILKRMKDKVQDPSQYPPDFIEELDGSLTLLEFLVRQTVPQIRRR